MTPDLERAATAAAETLIKYHVTTAPVSSLKILKSLRGVIVLSFTDVADEIGVDRQIIIDSLGDRNKDAVTLVKEIDGRLRYIVTFNQRMPEYILQRAIARELGHIVLGHDGSRPVDVRTTEALCFARHLLCPRPLIRALQDSGVPITIEMLGSITGCYERCLVDIQHTDGVYVPPSLNRLVRDQFADYVSNIVDCRSIFTAHDSSMQVIFGTYMDHYLD